MRFFARMRIDLQGAMRCAHDTDENPCRVVMDGITLSFGRRHLQCNPLAPPEDGVPLKTGDVPKERMVVQNTDARKALGVFAVEPVTDDKFQTLASVLRSTGQDDLYALVEYLWQLIRDKPEALQTRKFGAFLTGVFCLLFRFA
jgi:hypothetical protein